MGVIRKRSWTDGNGEPRQAWLVDYRDSAGKRRAKQFSRKKDAEAWSTQAAWHVTQGTHTPDSQSITVAKEAWSRRRSPLMTSTSGCMLCRYAVE